MRAVLAAIAATGLATVGHAADPDGRYAMKGGGLQTCEAFLDSALWRTEDVAAYGGWIEGYLTATNAWADGVYDLTPWQTTESLVALARSVCRQLGAETRFAEAMSELALVLRQSALTEESDVVVIEVDAATSLPIYVSVLDRVNEALRERGHEVATLPGHFGEDSRAALRAVQQDAGIAQSGIPDQRTLFLLLLDAAVEEVPG